MPTMAMTIISSTSVKAEEERVRVCRRAKDMGEFLRLHSTHPFGGGLT